MEYFEPSSAGGFLSDQRLSESIEDGEADETNGHGSQNGGNGSSAVDPKDVDTSEK